MKLLHSIACVMIGFAALASVAPSEAKADRVINVDPVVGAAIRFGLYSGKVSGSTARFEAACVEIRDQLSSDLAGTSSRSARRLLVKDAKQASKMARDIARNEIDELTEQVRISLGVHPAGVALFPQVEAVRAAAIDQVNESFKSYNREFQSMAR